jgi:hypothetical protein
LKKITITAGPWSPRTLAQTSKFANFQRSKDAKLKINDIKKNLFVNEDYKELRKGEKVH